MSQETTSNTAPEPPAVRAPWVETPSGELPGIDRSFGLSREAVARPRLPETGGEAMRAIDVEATAGDEIPQDLPAMAEPHPRADALEGGAVDGREVLGGGEATSKRPRKIRKAGDNSRESSEKKKPRSKKERMRGSLAEILDVEGAATALGISRRLALRLLREGKLPGKKVGREWRILRSAIVQWLKEPETKEPTWLERAVERGRVTVERKGD